MYPHHAARSSGSASGYLIRMEQRDQRFAQALLDQVQFRQRQAAFLELAVEQAFHQQVVNQLLQAARRWIGERSARALDGIGQHQDAELARLRLRTRITEAGFEVGTPGAYAARFATRFIEPHRFAVEIFDQRGAVMRGDEIDDRLREVILLGEGNTVLDVADDDERAEGRFERIVAVFT